MSIWRKCGKVTEFMRDVGYWKFVSNVTVSLFSENYLKILLDGTEIICDVLISSLMLWFLTRDNCNYINNIFRKEWIVIGLIADWGLWRKHGFKEICLTAMVEEQGAEDHLSEDEKTPEQEVTMESETTPGRRNWNSPHRVQENTRQRNIQQ